MRLSIFDRFLRRSTIEKQVMVRQTAFEPLEGRTLLSGATITGVTADNRGQIVVSLSAPIVAADVNTGSVQMYTAGPDNHVGTADDVQVTVAVHYTTSNNRITIVGNVPADEGYRIKLVATRLRDSDGTPIDGDFNGHFPTGDHRAGGNFEMQVKADKSATPTARLSTSLGTLDIKLFSNATKTNIGTPKNVGNFVFFANAGDYDNIFVTRDAPGFVAQMGGLNISAQDQVTAVPGLPSGKVIPGEPGNSNVTGTVAFALSGGPNTAVNEFFFNLTNNDGRSGVNLNDTSTGGGPFTVFGVVANSRSFAVLTAIDALNRLDLQSTSVGSLGTLVDNVPVNSDVPVTGETTGRAGQGGTTTKTIDPETDFVVISRTALLMRVVPLA